MKFFLSIYVVLVNQIFTYKRPFTFTYRFRKQVKSGSLEVISIPAYFYPPMLHDKESTEDSEKLERYDLLENSILK